MSVLAALMVLAGETGTRGAPAPPPMSATDYFGLRLPPVGARTLHILTPRLLELQLVTTKAADPARVSQWDLVNNGQFQAPAPSEFVVTVNGQPVAVKGVGFKRRPLSAPVAQRDLRILNHLYLTLAAPIGENQVVEVANPSGRLWAAQAKFTSNLHPLRFNPAIHVNQEGYAANLPKEARVGYYLGSMGEMIIPVASFRLVNTVTGGTVYQGKLTRNADVGFSLSPAPYQQVFAADFSAFKTPGEYILVLPGLGRSLPFTIDDGIIMGFTRAYALGLYHQRCGTSLNLPFTRFTHDVCHAAPASVPSPQAEFSATWNILAERTADYASTPGHSAPRLMSEATQLYPFVRQGRIDVSGGHHDAGDYSKYTANSAALVHYLMFAVDAFPGVAALDNLGLPNSGDGVPDILQEAKYEADFLAKLQDADGGFYFLVYPRDRSYEWVVMPDKGDPQVVWPKNTAVTAAAVAALAQCGSSPLFKRYYPAAAAGYLQKAQWGWNFLVKAIQRHGRNGAYQKITHYGNDFTHNDDLAWAAAEMFLATGQEAYHKLLKSWFNPADPATFRWGWWRMCGSYGAAIRSYAFAARTGRLPASRLDPVFLQKCQDQILLCAQDTTKWSRQNAYGSSFPNETKAVMGAGWFFSNERAFDITVGYQLSPRADFFRAILANLNYEGGCNPVNVSYITGLGWKRTRDVVQQVALADRRTLPPTGQPVGNIVGGFFYTDTYKSELSALSFPTDGSTGACYPLYDRWTDSWNVSAEFVAVDQARALGSLAFVATRTAAAAQPWRCATASIQLPATAKVGAPVTATLQVPGLNLSGTCTVWESRDGEPTFGATYQFVPKTPGPCWVEAEAQWPDGRRVFAAGSVLVQ